MDGSSQAQGGGAGIIIRTLDEPANVQGIKISFVVSNNKSAYEVVILGLRVAKCLSISSIELLCDSQLLAS